MPVAAQLQPRRQVPQPDYAGVAVERAQSGSSGERSQFERAGGRSAQAEPVELAAAVEQPPREILQVRRTARGVLKELQPLPGIALADGGDLGQLQGVNTQPRPVELLVRLPAPPDRVVPLPLRLFPCPDGFPLRGGPLRASRRRDRVPISVAPPARAGATALGAARTVTASSAATAGRRRAHLTARSQAVLRRAWIGSPASQRSRSSASASAEP